MALVHGVLHSLLVFLKICDEACCLRCPVAGFASRYYLPSNSGISRAGIWFKVRDKKKIGEKTNWNTPQGYPQKDSTN